MFRAAEKGSVEHCSEACAQIEELGLDGDFEIERWAYSSSRIDFSSFRFCSGSTGVAWYGTGQTCYLEQDEMHICTNNMYASACHYDNWVWNRSQNLP